MKNETQNTRIFSVSFLFKSSRFLIKRRRPFNLEPFLFFDVCLRFIHSRLTDVFAESLQVPTTRKGWDALLCFVSYFSSLRLNRSFLILKLESARRESRIANISLAICSASFGFSKKIEFTYSQHRDLFILTRTDDGQSQKQKFENLAKSRFDMLDST